jgi:hypothetical protein
MTNNELLAAVKAKVIEKDPSLASAFQSTGTQTDAFDAGMEAAPGEIPERVIEELRAACHTAVDYAGAFSDACKAQAEKYKIKPKALRRFIAALEADKVDDVDKETDDLATLIANRKAPE